MAGEGGRGVAQGWVGGNVATRYETDILDLGYDKLGRQSFPARKETRDFKKTNRKGRTDTYSQKKETERP